MWQVDGFTQDVAAYDNKTGATRSSNDDQIVARNIEVG